MNFVFVCPVCNASHDRGCVDGVDTFRCLGCGYIGHGWHTDKDIDDGLHQEFLDNRKWDLEHNIETPTFFEALQYAQEGVHIHN